MLFDGITVFFLKSSIPLSLKRIPLWTEKLNKKGGKVEKDCQSTNITHVLVGSKPAKISKDLRLKQVVFVQWLEGCLSKNVLLPTDQFIADPAEVQAVKLAKQRTSTTTNAPMQRYQAWLGHWKEDYNNITNLIEFVLQAKFNAHDSKNEPLVKLLNELQKFELAVQNEHSSIGDGPDDIINHKALQYARAAAVVRACSFQITADNLHKHEIPYLGASTRTVVQNLLSHNTCPELEAFREGSVVADSRGQPRGETVGADVKRLFKSLPGVGVGLARTWYNLGFRSFEDVIAADQAQQAESASPPPGKSWMTKNLRFALSVHNDLTEDCQEQDILDMKADLLAAFKAVTGEEWEVQLVGGGRRSTASHDADFVASTPHMGTEGVVHSLADHLVQNGRLVPSSRGMCSMQASTRLLSGEELGRSPKGFNSPSSHNLLADRHDHLLGIYITRAGKHRRMDVIISSWKELPFCTISWTGSKQYMRFMRQYAVIRGMGLNAHRIMAKVKGSWYKVPEEKGPHDRNSKEFWPSGWSVDRPVKTERDVFELLGLPWAEAWERNC